MKTPINVDDLKFTQMMKIVICGKDKNTIFTAFISKKKPVTRESIHPVTIKCDLITALGERRQPEELGMLAFAELHLNDLAGCSAPLVRHCRLQKLVPLYTTSTTQMVIDQS